MSETYDVVVIGAGPGGYVAAIRARQLGLKTAIVEKSMWGGVCLNVGCIPSKALLRNAEIAHLVTQRAKEFGIRGEVELDYGVAFKRSRRVSNRLVKGVQFLLRKNEIDRLEGWAAFKDSHTIQVSLNDGSERELAFHHAIIATGSRPAILPNTRISDRVVTYEAQIMADSLPEKIIIAGGSAIGVEFAYILHNYGVDVTLVEYMDRLVPAEDEEVSAELLRQFKRMGIQVLVGTRVDEVMETADSVQVVLTDSQPETFTLAADQVLQALGVLPNVGGFGVEELGIEKDEKLRGAIVINEAMQTSIPHIYAIGDVTMKLALAHVAQAMALIAAEHIAGEDVPALDYRMMPRATYCQPQIASFGYTETEARAQGYDVKAVSFPFQANGKALGLGESGGFIKLLCDARHGELLGGHMIGPEVTELLPELTLAQRWELTPAEIARNVHAHPTLSESLMEAAHGLMGHAIHI
ncbi:MAG: dihydrolipoyl dehydrogenase [Anaerolineaceae bacterium]|nr:dihydrolipoyl dehydrogenase [Anaerolineaceae bacterium]